MLREDSTDASTATLPAVWNRTDEWYNFQTYDNPVNGGGASAVAYNPRNNPDLHILLTTDTTSYAGAVPAGTDHPIAWCHKYDGGRSWYTALGHTQASYTEQAFLDHIYGGIQDAAGAVSSVVACCGKQHRADRDHVADPDGHRRRRARRWRSRPPAPTPIATR